MSTPEQKVYIAGDSSTDTFTAMSTLGRKKIGINGHSCENYYNRFIYDDKMPNIFFKELVLQPKRCLWPG